MLNYFNILTIIATTFAGIIQKLVAQRSENFHSFGPLET